MGLVGSLEDLGLGDILQIVSLSRKSGVLNLSWGEVKGKIIFRDGQVVAATSTGKNKSLASMIAGQGGIPAKDFESVDAAINSKADAEEVRDYLIKDLGIAADVVENAVRNHIESVVFFFFGWSEGIFSFELQEIVSELSAMKPPAHAFVLEVGLSPQFLAMEGTRIQDERRRDGEEEAPVGPPLKAGVPSSPPGLDQVPVSSETDFSDVHEPEPPAPPEPPAGTGPMDDGDEPEEDFGSVADALAYYEARQKKSGEASPETESAAPEEIKPGDDYKTVPAPEESSPPVPAPEDAPEGISASPPEPAAKAPERASDEGGAALVIVDDDPFMLESLTHHLAAKGYSIKTFTSVVVALAYIQEETDLGRRPAVVLADLIMPDASGESTLGGLDLLDSAKKINPGISLYIMTDYENLPARDKSSELGARFFFMKPKSSQLDEDFSSPELINFVAVVENALKSEPKIEEGHALPPEGDDGMINLGEELRREFGEEMTPLHPDVEYLTPSRGLHMLKTMISELNDPNSSGQITLLILRFAAELMNRAVIFLVAKNRLAGLGQFGIQVDGADPQQHVRQIRIPLNEPSIFREAIQKRLPLKKPLKDNKWNVYLVEHLGGQKPREVFVAPIMAGGKIAAILYGDNVPEQQEIGDTESLEIFLAQAGLAMEKALLERRLKEMGSSPNNKGR